MRICAVRAVAAAPAGSGPPRYPTVPTSRRRRCGSGSSPRSASSCSMSYRHLDVWPLRWDGCCLASTRRSSSGRPISDLCAHSAPEPDIGTAVTTDTSERAQRPPQPVWDVRTSPSLGASNIDGLSWHGSKRSSGGWHARAVGGRPERSEDHSAARPAPRSVGRDRGSCEDRSAAQGRPGSRRVTGPARHGVDP